MSLGTISRINQAHTISANNGSLSVSVNTANMTAPLSSLHSVQCGCFHSIYYMYICQVLVGKCNSGKICNISQTKLQHEGEREGGRGKGRGKGRGGREGEMDGERGKGREGVRKGVRKGGRGGGSEEGREGEEFLCGDTPGLQFSDLFSHFGCLLAILSDVMLILRGSYHMTFNQSHSTK